MPTISIQSDEPIAVIVNGGEVYNNISGAPPAPAPEAPAPVSNKQITWPDGTNGANVVGPESFARLKVTKSAKLQWGFSRIAAGPGDNPVLAWVCAGSAPAWPPLDQPYARSDGKALLSSGGTVTLEPGDYCICYKPDEKWVASGGKTDNAGYAFVTNG